MRATARGIHSILILLAFLLVSVLAGGCGSAAVLSPAAGASAGAIEPASAHPNETPSPLVGKWRRTGSCTTFVDAMRAAGLVDFVGLTEGKWMAGGVTPRGTDPTSTDYCAGAAAVEHSHFFTADGRFGSYDENGNVVDDGTYAIQSEDSFVIGQVAVRFQIDATDHLNFLDVAMADPCVSADTDCRAEHGWAISAFYPGDYERIGP